MAELINKTDSNYEPFRRLKRKAKTKEFVKTDDSKLSQVRQQREERERKIRERLLANIALLFKKVKTKGLKDVYKEEEIKEWERYINCNQMPYPEIPSSIRKHFLSWCQEEKFADIEEVNKSLNLYLPIFDIIKQISDLPVKEHTCLIKNLQEIMIEWKYEFLEKLDYACFLLIKDIRQYFIHLDFYTKEYHKNFENFKIGMWALLDVPMRSDFKRELPVIDFPELKITVSLPVPYNDKPVVLRVIYTTFDLFSDLTKTRYKPEYTNVTDLLTEVKRYEELKEAIQNELLEIQKEKARLAELEKEKLIDEYKDEYKKIEGGGNLSEQFQIKSSSEEDVFKSLEDYDRKSSRRSTNISMASHWTARSQSDTSEFSTISSQPKLKQILWGAHKTDSKQKLETLSTIENKKTQPFWETPETDKIQSRHSIGTLVSKIRPSNITNHSLESHSFEKLNIFDSTDRWSCPDLELLGSKDSLLDETKSFSFLDLIFYLHDNGALDFLNTDRSIRELVKQNCSHGKKNVININQEVKSVLEILFKREEERFNQFIEKMTIKIEPYEVNLRNYHNFSGIYFVDLLTHASDLCRIKMGNFIQMQLGPYQLQRENFSIPSDKQKSDSSIGNLINVEDYYFHLADIVEMKELEYMDEHQEGDEDEIENENELIREEKLVTVKICLRRNVFWFMRPQPAVWDKEKKIWSVEHVHEVVHDRQHYTITLKLGKVGPIAMFTLRFHELPYKNWILTPNEEEDIILTLLGQNITIEFKVVQDKVCLNQFEGLSQYLLQGMIGKQFGLHELMDKLKSIGLDIFPEDDTFLYIKGCNTKPFALEDHTYFTMAMFSKIIEFTASTWNLALGHNEIAFQCRLHTPYNPLPFRTFKANNFKCDMLLIEDEAQKFSDATIKDLGFHPDPYSVLTKLYGRNMTYFQPESTKIYTVYNLLTRTKVLTFSGNPTKCL